MNKTPDNDNPKMCIRCHKRPAYTPKNAKTESKLCAECILKALDTLFINCDFELRFEQPCKSKTLYTHCHCPNPKIAKILDLTGEKPVIHNVCMICKLPVKNVLSRMPKLIVTR